MNTEGTKTNPAQMDTRFLMAASAVPFRAERRKPTPRIEAINPIEQPKVDPAETARQESLDFLHKLVMG